jgi:hypothetical protein
MGDVRLDLHLKARCAAWPNARVSFSLDWWAWDRSVRAEHATIARLRLQPLATSLTVIEELASVKRHLFNCLVPTPRTGDCGFFDHGTGQTSVASARAA